jgi:hypothetical protein
MRNIVNKNALLHNPIFRNSMDSLISLGNRIPIIRFVIVNFSQ